MKYRCGSPPLYYAVKRKSCYFKLEQYVKDLKYAIFIEQLDKISSLLCGNVATINTFMGLRDYSAGSIIYNEREPQKNISFDNDKQILIKSLKDHFNDEFYSSLVSNMVLESYDKKSKSNNKILKFKGNIFRIIREVFLNSFLNINYFGIDKKFLLAFKESHKKLTKTFNKNF